MTNPDPPSRAADLLSIADRVILLNTLLASNERDLERALAGLDQLCSCMERDEARRGWFLDDRFLKSLPISVQLKFRKLPNPRLSS